MKTIGIADFERLVMERLENPSLFENKTLVLWNATYVQDGIAYPVIENCCIRYNTTHPDDQVWLKYSDFTFATDDYRSIKELCDIKDMYGFKTRGILFNTGCYMKPENEEWLSFINTHKNSVGPISSQWALIACMNDPDWDEESFGNNCTLYRLQPSIDEWYEWLKPEYPAAVLDPIVAYMRKEGLATDSYIWGRLLNAIVREMQRGDIKELNQISRHDFDLALMGSFPMSLVNDLWDFIV